MDNSDLIEVQLIDRPENLQVMESCLKALGIACRLERGNGQAARLFVSIDPQDDIQLLRLWDQLTDLRVHYLELRQAKVADQLSFMDDEERVIL